MSAINTGELLDALSEQRRDRPGVSTATLNLIAFIEDRPSVERLLDRLDKFAHKHACRAIVLDASRAETRRVHAACSQAGDTVLTQSEEILLGIAGTEPQALRSIVHDLLIPDISCALLWAGRDLRDPRFEALASLGTTVVVDSSRAADPKQNLRDLVELCSATTRYLRDLSYLRLLPWQDMIAQFFDDPELAKELPAIARVEIASGSEPEAYYLSGWLASRLAWQPCGDHELCNPAGETITIGMTRRGDPRRVQKVILRSPRTEFRAELDPRWPDLVCLTVAGKPSREQRCAPLHDIDLVSLVEEAMLISRNDPVFAGSLQLACAILHASS